MEDLFRSGVRVLILLSDLAGATTIALVIASVAYSYIRGLAPGVPRPKLRDIRLRLGRGLVLGLEFLIAADVLQTILGPTLQEIAILGATIVLRTILSLSIEYELSRFVQHDAFCERRETGQNQGS